MESALLLQARGPAGIPYADINPYALREPIAPHLAAARAGVRIDLDRIESAFRRLAARADGVIVEGIGGWRVPLNDAESTADLARRLELPVILVVGLRLGCINHALLTAEAIRRDGVELRGWIANGLDSAYETAEETVEFLEQRLDAPRIGSIGNRSTPTTRPAPRSTATWHQPPGAAPRSAMRAPFLMSPKRSSSSASLNAARER